LPASSGSLEGCSTAVSKARAEAMKATLAGINKELEKYGGGK